MRTNADQKLKQLFDSTKIMLSTQYVMVMLLQQRLISHVSNSILINRYKMETYI